MFTGACYGAVHTLSGHPLDNIKAKLQLDVNYHGKSVWGTIRKMWGEGRARAFWRGCVPPLWVLRFPLRASRAACGVGLIVQCQSVLASIACDPCAAVYQGSAVYRSIMMSSYEATYTFFEQRTAPSSFWHTPYCYKIVRPLVVASAVACSLCRVLAEAPIEQVCPPPQQALRRTRSLCCLAFRRK